MQEQLENSPEWNEKYQRQVELEELMRQKGVERYWANEVRNKERGVETRSKPVSRLLDAALPPVIAAINEFKAGAKNGKAGRRHSAVKYIDKLESEAVALIAVRTVLDGLTSQKGMIATARDVSRGIQDEISYRHFKSVDSKNHGFLVKRCQKEESRQRTRRIIRHNMERRSIETEDWAVDIEVKVGTKLIELVAQATGFVKTVTRTRRMMKETLIEPTEEILQWLREEGSRCSILSPVYLPTLIPPRPWTDAFTGGYWTPRVRRLRLMKSWTLSKEYLEELSESDIDPVLDALNATQNTEWCINNRVLETMRQLWEAGFDGAGIPSAEDYPLPPKPVFLEGDDVPPKEEWTELQMMEFKKWKHAASIVHETNAKLKSLRLQFVKVLHIAELFEEEESIFFPHQMDFRGRIYAVPLYLNPQGSDLAKGLLEFANTVPINDSEDAGWLAIHGANVYGYDKVSLRDREKWVAEHEREILAVANNPLVEKFWMDADKPVQFLAWCFEWARFKQEGYGFMSSLPVQMDGSCNGLQHFSAMLRDEVGGHAVNLLPTDLPQDVYGIVAEAVRKMVEKDAEGGNEAAARIARGWLQYGVTRKVCKRPVMTLSYGATEFGFRDQVFEDTVKPFKMEDRDNFPWEGSGWEAAVYMGKLIWECVGQVVIAARGAMEWLQGAAKIAAKEELPVRWTTPDGLPIVQNYPQVNTKRINLTFDSKRLVLSAASSDSRKMNKSKQASGIAPNWVHSMDAAHMRATVRACYLAGIRSFNLIHDSYGTHAGNAWMLAKLIRSEFINQYAGDVLETFKGELEEQLPEGSELPPVPAKGVLELDQVKHSDYFFA